ncbi:MAG TPA: hypothetical protein H9695_03730 [Candidatus Mediterraneibacter excrementigallinarum]|nr:hypothetical protein [Candidatus Mediterraneibacter excrementigallinarum]
MEQKKMKEIEKPVTVRISELKRDIQGVVIKSKLPPFLLEMILSEYLSGISTVARQEYAQDQAEWEAKRKGEGGGGVGE